VAVDVKEGVFSTATAKGGFSVKPSDGAPGYFDVLEEYSSLELAQGGGAKVGGTGTLDSNRWSCALLSPELRICPISPYISLHLPISPQVELRLPQPRAAHLPPPRWVAAHLRQGARLTLTLTLTLTYAKMELADPTPSAYPYP
jgi:hypothetical protein